MIDPDILRDLLAIGLTKPKQQQVIALIDRIYAKQEERLTNQRLRSQKYRDKIKSSRDGDVIVTGLERDAARACATYTNSKISNGTNTYIDNTNTVLTELDRLRPTKKQTARGTRLPSNWMASFEYRDYAGAAGFTEVQINRIEEDFRDYWIAQPGTKGVKLDWEATWRRWVRREAEKLASHRVTPLFPAKPLTHKEAKRAEALAGLDAIINGTIQLNNFGPNGGEVRGAISGLLPPSQPDDGILGGSNGPFHVASGKGPQGGL